MRLLSIVLKASVMVLMALGLATQVFAAVHHQHASLGAPVVVVGGLKFYAPWQGVQWARWWLPTHPWLFLWAGVAFGGALLFMGGVWIAAALGRFQQTPDKVEGALATGAELRKAKLLRKAGIVVGKQA